jgi:molecular chaperone GrpE (heat shock protein)
MVKVIKKNQLMILSRLSSQAPGLKIIMNKITIILCLFFVLIGASGLVLVNIDQKQGAFLIKEHHDKFNMSVDKMDKILDGKVNVKVLAETAPDDELQAKIDRYNSRKETRELVFTLSLVLACIGAGVLCAGVSLKISNSAVRLIKKLAGSKTGDSKPDEQVSKDKKADKNSKKNKKEIQAERMAGPLVDSRWKNFQQNYSRWTASSAKEDGIKEDIKEKIKEEIPEEVKVLDSTDGCESTETQTNSEEIETEKKPFISFRRVPTPPPVLQENTGSNDNELNKKKAKDKKSEEFEEKVAQFNKKAADFQEQIIDPAEPINTALRELTDQVSAIREYASDQQDRVTKLQDGYDWNIIRTFCLKIIRCIDNLEDRIEQLNDETVSCDDLEEIRDELVFALESSGVERFEPHINSEYRGQERKAEAIKDRVKAEDKQMNGKIAKVLRGGYQYIIDEENVKIVRTARVKLYG